VLGLVRARRPRIQGDREGTRQWFESAETLRQTAASDETYPPFMAACFARVGDFDAALRLLESVDHLGVVNHRFLAEQNRFFAPLRADPRFQALMEKAREKQRAFEVSRTSTSSRTG